MLPGQLTRRVAGLVTALVALTACAGVDGTERGALRENVIEPGITAIDESRVLACGSEASSFRTALEIYEIREGEPAPDEAALVASGLLRNESELWNIVDGRLVAEDPTCGDVPANIEATEIVTDASSAGALAVEDVLATLTGDDVASIGGPDCARQLAVVIAGTSEYVETQGVEPETLGEIEAAGHFLEPVTMWEVAGEALRPVAGSGCNDFVADQETEQRAQACRVEMRTLEVAREAYIAQFGVEPTRLDLVDAEFIRESAPGAPIVMDFVDGVVQPVPDGECDGIDLTPPEPNETSAVDDCTASRRTLEVAVEAFFAQTGELPRTEKDLVTAGMLRELMPLHDLGADASVVAAPGSGCG